MGFLDDAIRQHLELKRQHGAPEEELERQEEEALGPARRDVSTAGDGELELEPAGETSVAEAASDEETELFEPEAAPDDQETELFEPDAAPDEDEPAIDEPDAALDEREAALDEPPSAFDEPERGAAETPFDLEDEPEQEPRLEDVPEPDAIPPSPVPFDSETAFEEFGEEEPQAEEEDPEDEGEPPRDEADVLEDTPDFLQETPEHDRLWFEQKPPRDFDFD